MKEIRRYNSNGECRDNGDWCYWKDVEKLQQELQDVTAKALAAVWLLVGQNVVLNQFELENLRDQAKDVFDGENERVIEKLHEEVGRLQEYTRSLQRPVFPGVRAVYGISLDQSKGRFALMLTSLQRDNDGGLILEVQLP